jgi:multidrug efflux system membrane fusion protein
MRVWGWIVGATTLILSLVAFQRLTKPSGPAIENGGGSAAPVRVAVVEQRDMPVIERSVGTMVANTLVQVAPLVSGTLERQAFRDGQFVQKGALLFEIDPRPYRAALEQAQAVYRRDQAQLDNALRDKQRFETLFAQESASQQARDSARANADMLMATVAADKAAVDVATLNLSFTQVRAPVTGKTGSVLIQPGNMVVAGSGASITSGGLPGGGGPGAGPVLVSLAEVRPIKVSFTLPEGDLPRVQARQRAGTLTATLQIQGSNSRPTAPVTFSSNAVNSQSGTIELRAQFPNSDLSLVPGELVDVVVELDTIRSALVVPRDAVNDGPTGPYVYVIDGNKADRRAVTVLFDDGLHAAIAGALHPGDQVITEGQLRVDPGSKVHVLPPARPEDSGPGNTGIAPR